MPEERAPGNAGRVVHAAAFGQPGLVLAGDRWWAYASSGPAGASPVLSSVDLLHWEREPDALTVLGAWAQPGSFRCPEVVADSHGGWLLYYAAAVAGTGRSAIGVARASAPGGPFHDSSGAPLRDSATDPSVLERADGTRWLVWTTPLGDRVWTRRLAPDGRALTGPAARILDTPTTGPAEAVSGPQVVGSASGLVLVYTAAPPDGVGRVLTARSPAPDGLFAVDPRPLLTSGGRFEGPAHASAVRDPDGRWWVLFTAWEAGRAAVPGAVPRLWLAALDPAGGEVSDPVPPPVPLPAPPGRWRLPLPADPTAEQEAVVRGFTAHGLIRALPAAYARRVVLLDLLAQLFEPGLRYPEPEVDRRLSAVWAPGVHPDYARLRRLLVDHGFLDRTGGVYRRSGGTV